MQIPSVLNSESKNGTLSAKPKKGVTFLVTLGAFIIVYKCIIATQLFLQISDSNASQELIDIAWNAFMNSILDAFFQGAVIIGLGMIYHRI